MSNVIPFTYSREAFSGESQGGDMINQYKLYVRAHTKSAATVRSRDHYINNLSATVDVTSATPQIIEAWLHSHGWAPSSINSALASVRHFYKWAVRHGHLTIDPTRDVERVREPRKMGRIAADTTIVNGMMRAPVDTRVMIMLGAECGLRRHEIAKVHRNDIEGEWLYITGKGGDQRVTCLSPELLELLEYLPARGFLFPSSRGGHLSGDAVYRRIRRVVGVNTHSLRHRAGTVVFEKTGNNLRVAQEFLGHATIATTQKYVHTTRADLRRASEAARLAA